MSIPKGSAATAACKMRLCPFDGEACMDEWCFNVRLCKMEEGYSEEDDPYEIEEAEQRELDELEQDDY